MTEFTVFTQDDLNPAWDDIEIGKAGALHIGSMVMPFVTSYGIIDGQQWWQVRYPVPTTDIKVRLREWELVDPLRQNWTPKGDRLNRDLLLVILVRMMGGAVTISPFDVMAAKTADLQVFEENDPWRFVVKVEDK